MTSPPYRFGDGDVASARLALLAEVFAPASRAFVERHRPEHVALAVDLGCGPGHTTRMLATATGAEHTIGVDRSEDFLARAAADAPAGVTHVAHDVTALPFPWGPADVVYARYLLAHLPEPAATVAAWRTQLRSGGVLLLDEVARIDTDVPTFARYLEVVTAVLALDGVAMYAGRVLADLPEAAVVAATVAPPPATVARMFAMNLLAWRSRAEQAGVVAGGELDALGEALAAIEGRGDRASGRITWTMAQACLGAAPARSDAE